MRRSTTSASAQLCESRVRTRRPRLRARPRIASSFAPATGEGIPDQSTSNEPRFDGSARVGLARKGPRTSASHLVRSLTSSCAFERGVLPIVDVLVTRRPSTPSLNVLS
jgi:hypothetical protein